MKAYKLGCEHPMGTIFGIWTSVVCVCQFSFRSIHGRQSLWRLHALVVLVPVAFILRARRRGCHIPQMCHEPWTPEDLWWFWRRLSSGRQHHTVAMVRSQWCCYNIWWGKKAVNAEVCCCTGSYCHNQGHIPPFVLDSTTSTTTALSTTSSSGFTTEDRNKAASSASGVSALLAAIIAVHLMGTAWSAFQNCSTFSAG